MAFTHVHQHVHTHLPEHQDLVGRPQVLQLVCDQDATLVLQQSAHAPVATHTHTGIRTLAVGQVLFSCSLSTHVVVKRSLLRPAAVAEHKALWDMRARKVYKLYRLKMVILRLHLEYGSTSGELEQ